MKNFFLIFSFSLLIIGCTKAPKEEFSTNKTSYVIQQPHDSLVNDIKFKQEVSQLTPEEQSLLAQYIQRYTFEKVFGDVVTASQMFPISVKDAILRQQEYLSSQKRIAEENESKALKEATEAAMRATS